MDSNENTSLNSEPGDHSFTVENEPKTETNIIPGTERNSKRNSETDNNPESEKNPKSDKNPEKQNQPEDNTGSENASESISGDDAAADRILENKSREIPQKTDETKDAKEEVKKNSGNKTKNKTRKKKTAGYYALSFLIKIGVTALILWVLLTWVVGLYVNHSNSSYPMLKDGDLCLTYKLGTVVRGDEVAYVHEDELRFGRIVGTAGDVVDVNDGSITINGYGVFEDAVYPTTAEGAKITFPYTVPEDTVFVLNDYRGDPEDSRVYGGILLKDLRGKVIMVLRRRGI